MHEKIQIYVWPDGTWCYKDELTEYDWKSDDYIKMTVDNDETVIEEAVIRYLNV